LIDIVSEAASVLIPARCRRTTRCAFDFIRRWTKGEWNLWSWLSLLRMMCRLSDCVLWYIFTYISGWIYSSLPFVEASSSVGSFVPCDISSYSERNYCKNCV